MKIWTNINYGDDLMAALLEKTANHEFVTDRTKAEIVLGRTDPAALHNSLSLRWIHVDAAGYESYDNRQTREWLSSRKVILTNSSAVYAEPCAQHLVAMMLALARHLPSSLDNQRQNKGWPMFPIRGRSNLLNGQTVVMLGFGAIARRVAELLAPYEMKLAALRRTPGTLDGVQCFTEPDLFTWLPKADHLLNILPANSETSGFVNAARLGSVKPSAIYYSIGRGVTTDQEALTTALQSGRPAFAYLDVTTPEPLPSDNPLWKLQNCYITPHTAGGHVGESERLLAHFIANLRRFEKGEELVNRVI